MTDQHHDAINTYLRGSLADSVTVTPNRRTGKPTDQRGETYEDANDLLVRLADRSYRRNSTRRIAGLDAADDTDQGQG